ncbi:MAG: hypothetical protein BWZ10_02762 [candidate division BRC1 bacterium ADurb.BinA364]|nr:MAG: hypothetical protein BWZ10_02762 [candidate division BRC1 bacterium ADurb.BinA364]
MHIEPSAFIDWLDKDSTSALARSPFRFGASPLFAHAQTTRRPLIRTQKAIPPGGQGGPPVRRRLQWTAPQGRPRHPADAFDGARGHVFDAGRLDRRSQGARPVRRHGSGQFRGAGARRALRHSDRRAPQFHRSRPRQHRHARLARAHRDYRRQRSGPARFGALRRRRIRSGVHRPAVRPGLLPARAGAFAA